MIYDTFLFNDDLPMLRMRLEELKGKVSYHVLVEARYDHQGKDKPLVYDEHKDEFAEYSHKIIPVVADIPGPAAETSSWVRERAQREWVRAGLLEAGVRDDDVVLLCDVDEIPSSGVLVNLGADEPLPCIYTLKMDMAMFAVDWVLPAQQDIAVAGYFRDMRTFPLGMLRDNSYRRANPVLANAGWHFSWLGGPEEIERKCGFFCHSELTSLIQRGNKRGLWYEDGWTWYGEDWTHRGVPPEKNLYQMIPTVVSPEDEWYPKMIREHRCPDKWFRPLR